jgi:hypothetical protein
MQSMRNKEMKHPRQNNNNNNNNNNNISFFSSIFLHFLSNQAEP